MQAGGGNRLVEIFLTFIRVNLALGGPLRVEHSKNPHWQLQGSFDLIL